MITGMILSVAGRMFLSNVTELFALWCFSLWTSISTAEFLPVVWHWRAVNHVLKCVSSHFHANVGDCVLAVIRREGICSQSIRSTTYFTHTHIVTSCSVCQKD